MSIPDQFRKEADALPPVLRALLDAEVAAGNQIVETGHGFPGQPYATYLKLANHFTARPRVWRDGLQFNDFGSFRSSGAFTDHDACSKSWNLFIEALKAAKLEQPEATEDLLLGHGIKDWRDVEAMVALDTRPARDLVKAAMRHSDPDTRMAVTR